MSILKQIPPDLFVHFLYQKAPKKKSRGVRLYDLGNQLTSPLLELICLTKQNYNTSIISFAVWHMAHLTGKNIIRIKLFQIGKCFLRWSDKIPGTHKSHQLLERGAGPESNSTILFIDLIST